MLSFQASLLSQVATRLSIIPVSATGSEVKTTEHEKSYKEKLFGSWISNTVEQAVVARKNMECGIAEMRNCGNSNHAIPQSTKFCISYSGAVSVGTMPE